MVRPFVSLVMAQCFCCSSREMKELPGMCVFVCLRVCVCLREEWNKWRAKSTETVRNGLSVHPVKQKWQYQSYVGGYGCLYVWVHYVCFACLLYLLMFSCIQLYLSGALP